MKTVNFLIFTLIFFSFAILMGRGHGAVPIGLLELISIPVYFTPDGIVDDESIFFLFLLLLGHILLVLALFAKKNLWKTILILAGEIFILSTIIFFTKDFQTSVGVKFTLVCSIPAIINMIILSLYLFLRRKNFKPVTV